MKPITNSTKAIVLTILFLTVIFIFCQDKTYNYKKVNSIEYNPSFNEEHPIIDTLTPYYKNTNPIYFRTFTVAGHTIIGELNGGSRTILIHDLPNCKKCKDYFLSLNSHGGELKESNCSSASDRGTPVLP